MFYPYYEEYLANMLGILEKGNLLFDAIVGHYADGMLLSSALGNYYASKGVPTPVVAVTHSLGLQKVQSVFSALSAVS